MAIRDDSTGVAVGGGVILDGCAGASVWALREERNPPRCTCTPGRPMCSYCRFEHFPGREPRDRPAGCAYCSRPNVKLYDYYEAGNTRRACRACISARKTWRPNPGLLVITGNPPRLAELERAWARFHQADEFIGDTVDVGRIPGAPSIGFALGRLHGIDLGRGRQRFSRRPWLVASPDDDSLWIVSKEPMNVGSAAGLRVRSVTYDPMGSSRKAPAYYRHEFKRPLPVFAPVGAARKTRAILLQGGRYFVDDWIYD